MRVQFKIPRGDTVQGEVIHSEFDKDYCETWYEVRLDTPETQKGCHGDEVVQGITEVRASDVKYLD